MENITVVPAVRLFSKAGTKVTIIIRVIAGRKVAKTINTGLKIEPEHWDPARRLVTSKDPGYILKNQKLKQEVSKLENQITSKSLMGVPLTKQRVKKIAEGKDPGRDFFKFCEEWLPAKYQNKETLRTYQSEVTKLRKFSSDVSFGDIDFKFLTAYKRYMHHVLKNSSNTIWKTFKFLNTMILDGMKMKGIIDQNPFDEFNRGSYQDPEKLGIEISDCDKIYLICMDENQPVIIRKVATKFLLMCYSGLRFEDAMTFDPIVHVIDGQRIQLKTQKAQVVLNLKLYSRLRQIIDLLKGDGLKLSNQEFNRWLKIIGEMAGIQMKLTCHVGRHTFGGLLAEMEIPEEQAQKLLAHRDIRSTRVYYHVKAKNLDRAADKLNDL